MTDLPPSSEHLPQTTEHVESQQATGPTKREQAYAHIKSLYIRQRIILYRLTRAAKRKYANYKKQRSSNYNPYPRFQLSEWYASRRVWLRRFLAWWTVDRGQLLFNGILTFATISAWVAMLSQNNLMRDQMDQTDKTLGIMELEQRAWLSVGDVSMPKPEAGKGFTIKFPIANTGRVPGNVTNFQFRISIHDTKTKREIGTDESLEKLVSEALEQLKIVQSTQEAIFVVAPSGKTVFDMRADKQLDPKVVAALNDGTYTMHIYGGLTYSDSLRTKGVTYYCRFWHPRTGTVASHRIHNGME